MAAIKNLKVGQTLWQVKRVKCGNTTRSVGCLYPVKVLEISEDLKSIKASWNNNPPRRYGISEVAKLKVSKPSPKGEVFGIPSY